MDDLYKAQQMVTFIRPDGTTERITKKESDRRKRELAKKNAKKKSASKAVTLNGSNEYVDPINIYPKVQKLIRTAAPLESLYTFMDHAHRSYGNIADEMIEPFLDEYTEFSKTYRSIKEILAKIEKYGKNNEYETYSEARNLSYKLEDMQIALVNLCDAVESKKREHKEKYGNTPAYNGRTDKNNPKIKKELGFVDQLFSKNKKVINKVLTELYAATMEIVNIADKGRDPLTYKEK